MRKVQSELLDGPFGQMAQLRQDLARQLVAVEGQRRQSGEDEKGRPVYEQHQRSKPMIRQYPSHGKPSRVKEYVFVVPSDLIMIDEPIPQAPFENRHCFVEFPVFIE